MIRDRRVLGLACFAAIAVLAACGGGGGGSTTPSLGGSAPSGGSSPTPAPTASPTLAAGQAYEHISITLPSAQTASNARRAQFVDPHTQSLTLTLLTVNGASVTSTVQGPFNTVAANTTNCTTANSSLTCTFQIAAPIGKDVFLANTFSAPGGVDPLGSGAVSFTVQANATNSADLTLTGPIYQALIASNNGVNSDTLWDGNGVFTPITFTQYTSEQNTDSKSRLVPQRAVPLSVPTVIPSERLYVIAEDQQGNTIFTPTSYNEPITLTLNLNGGSANSILTDTPPSGLGCGAPTSTSVDQGTVSVCSPFDVITLSLITSVPSTYASYYDVNFNFPYITATIASPPAGSANPLTSFPFTVEVTPPTPGPSDGNLPVTVQ